MASRIAAARRAPPPSSPDLRAGAPHQLTPEQGAARSRARAFTRREDLDVDAGGEPRGVAREDPRRLDQRRPAEPLEPDREQRAPVDRDREPRPQQRGGASRSERIHVTGSERRPPTPDGQQGDVEVLGQAAHRVEQVGVAGEVDRLRRGDHEPERDRRRCQAMPAAVVVRRHRRHADAVDVGSVPGQELRRPPRSRAAAAAAPRRRAPAPPRRGPGVAARGRRGGRGADGRSGPRRAARSRPAPAARRAGAGARGARAGPGR